MTLVRDRRSVHDGVMEKIKSSLALKVSWSLLSVLLAGGAHATASETTVGETSWRVSGSARLRFEDSQWYGSAGSPTSFARTDFFSLRVRPTIEWEVEQGLKTVLTPQFAKILGRDYAYDQKDSSGSIGYNENLHMHEAYLEWTLSPHWKASAGRMILSYGDQYIVAAGEWPLTGRSFDGGRIGYADEFLHVDVLGLKIDAAKDVIGSDRELVGIYSKWNLFEEMKAFDIYGLYESNQQGGANESRHVYGLRIGFDFEKTFDVTAEWATQRGTASFVADTGYQSMLVASAGWTLSDFYKMRIGLEYNQADREWRDWYPLLKGPLGRNEVVGRRNLQAMAAKVSFAPSDKLKVRLDYWMYQRMDDQAPVFRPQDSVAVGTANGSTSNDIGNAVDLALNFKSSDKVEYGIGATVFYSGSYLKDQFQDRVLTDFYAVTNLTF